MSTTEYIKVFDGTIFMVNRIQGELESIGIIPVIKDEGESQRLGGQGIFMQGYQQIFVNNEELEKAMEIINRIVEDVS